MTTQRKPRPTSKPEILAAAVSLARKHGLRKFSRADVAKAAKMASATISYHFGGMNELRRAVVQYAMAHEVLAILADARADRNVERELHNGMTPELKRKVAAYVAQ